MFQKILVLLVGFIFIQQHLKAQTTKKRDSLEVDYIHTGYEDNKTHGWKVTVDFEIIHGTSVAEQLAVHKIYDGNYSYGEPYYL